MPIDISKEEVYGKIQAGVDDALKEYRREYIPSRILVDLLDTWSEEGVELFLASYPETPSLLLERIAYMSKNISVLCSIASHPRTAAKIMQDLASHEDDEVRLMLASNKQISPQTAALLSEDDSVLIRAELAGNPALPTRVQSHLLSDPAAMVRSVFCDAKTIDPDHLQKLLMDPDYIVKARTAITAKVTDETLLKWADSDDAAAQFFLLARKNLPPKVTESLSFSSHTEIQKLAISYKALAEDEQLGWANGDDVELRITVASKEELTPKVQLVLASDDSLAVREVLAQNRFITEETQKILAEDPEGSVSAHLLNKEDLSVQALNQLCESCDEDTAFELALSTDLSDDQVGLLANKGSIELIFVLARRGLYTSLLMRERVVELVNSRMPTLVAFAIKSTCLKKEELAKFIVHPCAEVRHAVMENKNVSLQHIQKLAKDDMKLVSERAVELLLLNSKSNPKQGGE